MIQAGLLLHLLILLKRKILRSMIVSDVLAQIHLLSESLLTERASVRLDASVGHAMSSEIGYTRNHLPTSLELALARSK